MMGAIFAQHVPLIRDYPSAPPPPPAPPAPPTPPNPPQAEPIAFSVVTRASLFGIVGSATGTITLATVTCADAAMTIDVSDVVPGLTFSYAAKVLTVAGTPTGPTMVYRVVVSYVSSDGNSTIRGSSSHEITIVDASEVLTIGGIAGITGRVGFPLDVTICTPTANFDADVNCFGTTAIHGLSVAWSWNRALRSGTLSVAGTPEQTFGPNGGFSFNFIANGQTLGSGVSSCTIVQRYEAAAPAPAPSPPPPAPSPLPPPVPTPSPAPGAGPDPFADRVRVLLHFDAVLSGIGYDPASTAVTIAGKNDAPGQNWFNSPHCYQQVNPGLGYMQRFGYSPMAGGFFSLSNAGASHMDGIIAGCDGLDEQLTVECFIDIHQVAWDALKASGNDSRFCPVVTYRTDGGHVVWALGLVSQILMIGAVATREVRPAFYAPLVEAAGKLPSIYALGPVIVERPARFVHLCAMLAPASGGIGFDAHAAAWFNGVPFSASTATPGDLYLSARRRRDLQGARVRVGGAIPGVPGFTFGPSATLVPFCGGVDEVRVTAASRYADRISNSGVFGLLPAQRVIPWPNY